MRGEVGVKEIETLILSGISTIMFMPSPQVIVPHISSLYCRCSIENLPAVRTSPYKVEVMTFFNPWLAAAGGSLISTVNILF